MPCEVSGRQTGTQTAHSGLSGPKVVRGASSGALAGLKNNHAPPKSCIILSTVKPKPLVTPTCGLKAVTDDAVVQMSSWQ